MHVTLAKMTGTYHTYMDPVSTPPNRTKEFDKNLISNIFNSTKIFNISIKPCHNLQSSLLVLTKLVLPEKDLLNFSTCKSRVPGVPQTPLGRRWQPRKFPKMYSFVTR